MKVLKTAKHQISCGFLIFSERKHYLLCHTTCHKTPPKQPLIPSQINDEKWTIPKGMVDESIPTQVGDAVEIETAVRELKEETGIDLKENEVLRREFYEKWERGELKFNLHTEYKIKSKVVRVYLLDDEKGLIKSQYSLSDMKCSSLIDIDHPLKGYPEVDAFLWCTKSEALKIALKSQKVLFK
ncbi:hypothetical protein FDP41_000776 [Naegleria fowleri]|uniref:Nudix hydrolase domain-containing protein n=1 Tax=Naegleria fowleri TaxID=5763 RepID=A0A6A5C6F7_NAEFO|nr:uncharacterized protein FDP41_000776 [Naegleria fowleri]KAF0984877.1 hypothetical protein FDP41_000776 [Naegleria fowleri]CAG4714704.1 unnamed protein product [Naegleria fowleri]